MRLIRIESVPPGDAPFHIREAWVGLVLPLAERIVDQPVISASRSVLANKHGFWLSVKRFLKRELEEQPTPVYAIDVLAAIDVLQRADPTAAQWWKANTPHLFHEGHLFAFSASCCIEISDIP
ncbi:hypothetical protein [Dyella tabacisoli]|uniref:Uncharacterized protein n=1 Tax=Dyella tabacisoli TaxID=2282381 RepID=A0A369UT08_9GAMM|nr:hypothetical protein [Dyella tabacisoli]RDD81479.1 hypothetical protein DVJ77_09845 [Dyella tabacisoli]